MNRAALTCTRELMDRAIPDCLVEGHESLTHGIELPDADDRHVVAAASRGRVDVIVTVNLDDCPCGLPDTLRNRGAAPVEFASGIYEMACFNRQEHASKSEIHLDLTWIAGSVSTEPTRAAASIGLGFCLSLVKAIIEAHQGRVEVTSKEGKGSEFRIFLPLKSRGNQTIRSKLNWSALIVFDTDLKVR